MRGAAPGRLTCGRLTPSLLEQKMAPMRHFLACLTPELRLQIIRYKLSVLTPAGRTPMYSGYFIYKAFIDEGLTDFEQVTQYLGRMGSSLAVETAATRAQSPPSGANHHHSGFLVGGGRLCAFVGANLFAVRPFCLRRLPICRIL